MSNEAVAAPLDNAAAPAKVNLSRDIITLVKARMGLLAAIIALAGYYMGTVGPVSVSGMLHVFFGTWIVCAGAFLLNMYMERDVDSMMARTANRPLAARRVPATPVFVAGLIVTAMGVAYLAFFTNLLAAASGAVAMFGYVYIYTPMKRITTLNTIVGSFPGAMPPIIGWAAATNEISAGAIVMFMILFLWQVPHFLALAWMYRDEYREAGFVMISHNDPEGIFTTRQNLIYGIAYILVSLLPTFFGLTGFWYLGIAAASGLWFIWLCLRWFAHRERKYAVHVFVATLFHSPLLYVTMVLDKIS